MPRKAYDFTDEARRRSKEKEQARRDRINSLPKEWTREDKETTLLMFDHRCAYCGALEEDVPLEYDHYIDVYKEDCMGTVCGNMVPSCRPCNRRKGSKGAESIISKEKMKEIEDILVSLGGVF